MREFVYAQFKWRRKTFCILITLELQLICFYWWIQLLFIVFRENLTLLFTKFRWTRFRWTRFRLTKKVKKIRKNVHLNLVHLMLVHLDMVHLNLVNQWTMVHLWQIRQFFFAQLYTFILANLNFITKKSLLY